MIVDNNVCLHCGACIGICPPNAMFLYETSTIVFLPHCTECGLCAVVCPVGAIDGSPGTPVPPAMRPRHCRQDGRVRAHGQPAVTA